MTETPDPLAAALHDALMSSLLGRTEIDFVSYDMTGNMIRSTATLDSVLADRTRKLVLDGEFDDVIRQGMDALKPEQVAEAFAGHIAEGIRDGLNDRGPMHRNDNGWIRQRARDVATEACKTAVSTDEDLMDKLRAMIGSQVDRNKVGITVQLSDPET